MKSLIVVSMLASLALPVAASAQTAPAPPAPGPAPSAPGQAGPAGPTATGEAAPSPEELASRARFRSSCGPFIKSHCANVFSGNAVTPEERRDQRGKVRACLSANKDVLSADCRTALAEREAAAAARAR